MWYQLREGPDRLYIEREDRKKFYDKLLGEDSPIGRHRGFQNKDIFILAMCIGFQEKNRQKLDKKEGFILEDRLSEEDTTLLCSLAVFEEGDLKVLLDKQKVYSIAEEYAKGGIPILYDKVFGGGFGRFEKKFEAELVKLFKDSLVSNGQTST